MSQAEFTLRIIVMGIALTLFLAGAALKAFRPQIEVTPVLLIGIGFVLMVVASSTDSSS